VPGFLSEYNKVTRLQIDPEGKWWVDVKENITRRESAVAQTALVRPVVRYAGADSETKGDVDTVAYQMELVVAAVVDWNLTDEGDVVLPLTPPDAKRESINRLPDKVFNIIAGHVQGVDREASSVENARFPKDGVARSSRKLHSAS
jgi:hypothetical protein